MQGAGGLAVGAALFAAGLRWPFATASAASAASALHRVDSAPSDVLRPWLGPELWANRLADWQLNQGRIECLVSTTTLGIRTVGILTEEMVPGPWSCQLTVHTGTLASGIGGSGFLIGAGGGQLDWRAAALVQRLAGTGGGFLCLFESDGQVRFRDHAQELNPTALPVLPSVNTPTTRVPRSVAEDVLLTLDIAPSAAVATFDVTLTATDATTGALLSQATRVGVPEAAVLGGVSLVSGPTSPKTAGARYWFAQLCAGGPKLVTHPERATGPIMGALYSLSSGVLKLSAHMMPVSVTEPQDVLLQIQAADGSWTDGPTATIDACGVAGFRVTGWDSTQPWPYQLVYGPGTSSQASYAGIVAAEPDGTSQLRIATVSCAIHTFRSLTTPSAYAVRMPGERPLGLYTADSMYFPYADVVASLTAHQADLLVALGDQYYDTQPWPVVTGPGAILDMRSRWHLWLWSFRDLTATRPTIVLVDDHDVYQPNLWGHAGAPATSSFNFGGYAMDPTFVNAVQGIQCGHNPDPYDPTQVLQGIDVYYGTFRYGGTSFAVLEDRKFKLGNYNGKDPTTGQALTPTSLELLGARQELFLSEWALMDLGMPKVVLTQTLWATLSTRSTNAPAVDYDSNGYPPLNRSTAVALVKAAGAIVLSGDQHLASLVRHGLQTFTDGPVQFTGPAVGSGYQRWFEPRPLANPEATPSTGDFTDAFGNRVHVLAVANPSVTQARWAAYHSSRMVGDRNLKKDGYGIVRVDYGAQEFVFECWPCNADPAVDSPYPGWPYHLPFTAV